MRFDSKYDNRYDEADEPNDLLSDQLHEQNRANRRLAGGILASVILHLLALSLQFGIPGLDFPSFEAPWKERRTALERMQVTIVNPAPKALPVPPTPAVTIPELFKLPEPVLPPPMPKSLSALADSGLTLVAPMPLPKPKPIKEREQVVLLSRSTKKRAKTQAKLIPIEPQVNTVLPPAAKSTPVIAQDERKDDAFLVPVAKPEAALQTTKEIGEFGDNTEVIPEDAVIDKDVEIKRLEEERLAQLEKTKLEELRRRTEQQERQKQEKIHKAAQELAQKLAQQSAQREREQALEEVQRETKRQELLTQETLRQEEQRRQAEQQRQHQLALAQEVQKQELLAQAQRQQQAKEESEKQRALEIAERKRQEEVLAQKAIAQQLAEQKIADKRLLEQKLAEQKLAEQKIAEQKIAEQKIAEQKLAEQKLAEQKLAEQKLAEQKLAEQKLAEQKLAEQKLAEQKLTEQKLLEQKLAEQKLADAAKRAETERANAARLATTGNGAGNTTGTGSIDQAALQNRGDLASRLREQARSGDLFKSTPTSQGNDQSARRRSFLGAYDREVPLRMYLDSIKHKLERNGNLIYEKRSLSNVENNVLVNMKIRSDGSIEEVIIVRSSGSRAIDDKARNIVLANAPYSVFPMGLAAKYDVIEVQRVWNFGDKLRILEELP